MKWLPAVMTMMDVEISKSSPNMAELELAARRLGRDDAAGVGALFAAMERAELDPLRENYLIELAKSSTGFKLRTLRQGCTS